MKFKMVHENYNVADLNKSIAFYEKALGLREVRRKNGNGFIIVYMGNEESSFQLELTWLEEHPQAYNLGECEFHLAFKTDDFDTLLEKLNAQISTMNGYVEQSDISGNSIQSTRSKRWAYMTVRIPSNSLDSFISSVETNGNVTNKSETTTDVTLKYSDLKSKKKS